MSAEIAKYVIGLQSDASWREPVRYDLSSTDQQSDAESLFASGLVWQVRDGIDDIANDLFEIRNPDKRNSEYRRREFTSEITKQGVEFGQWFYFPWSRQFVRYPEQEDHFDLRTARNRELITQEEQRVLGSKTIAAYGLSVGSSIVEEMVEAGIGSHYILGDFDTLSPTNLNRLRSSMSEVGLSKVDILAKRISEIDPYIRQTHEHGGYTDASNILMDELNPDLIIEEVDNLPAKARIRAYASETERPLIMATDIGDRSILDIERHDLGKVKPFLGKVSLRLYADLVNGVDQAATEKELRQFEAKKKKATANIIGLHNVSPRMLNSVMEIDRTIAGNPQLGSTARGGAALSTKASIRILLGKRMQSGSYVSSPKTTLRMGADEGLLSTAKIWGRFIGQSFKR